MGGYPLVSDNEKNTIIQVRFVSQNPEEDTLDEVTAAATPESGSDLETSIGGDAYKDAPSRASVPSFSACSCRT